MGFQFCGFFRRREKTNEFAAVRSDQMASGSGQVRKPPNTSNLNLVHVIQCLAEGIMTISGPLLGGILTRLQTVYHGP